VNHIATCSESFNDGYTAREVESISCSDIVSSKIIVESLSALVFPHSMLSLPKGIPEMGGLCEIEHLSRSNGRSHRKSCCMNIICSV